MYNLIYIIKKKGGRCRRALGGGGDIYLNEFPELEDGYNNDNDVDYNDDDYNNDAVRERVQALYRNVRTRINNNREIMIYTPTSPSHSPTSPCCHRHCCHHQCFRILNSYFCVVIVNIVIVNIVITNFVITNVVITNVCNFLISIVMS